MPIKKLKIHFIGIGGIGVSALAKYYLEKGCEVSGSDLVSSEITDVLGKLGAKIIIGPHKPENLPKDIDLVIYSPAVKKDNSELKFARKLGIKCQSYPEALGELTKQYFTIAVSGTHGKSTTTAMLGILLVKAGLDPTVIVGTKVKEFNDNNCRVGKSEYLVIEADEHFASFLNYWPKIIILTTIEADHLDYYKNLGNILKVFKKYIGHLPEDGVLVANKDERNIQEIIGDRISRGDLISLYSLKQKEAKKLKQILKVPGDHNISNALAALTAARALKIPDKISFKALSEYRGSWRRFEITRPVLAVKGGSARKTIISDYGHHPTEVKVTFKAAREKYPKQRIWCVFQPHQYQRTHYLFKDFVNVFKQALCINKIIITDIYDVAGREEGKIKEKVNSEKLVKAIKRKDIMYLPKEKILDYLKKNLSETEPRYCGAKVKKRFISSPFDVLIIMGAGDIYKLISNF
ncbi:MAG: UDP-N-acetylmuramate--L-alanine ligase [bacterium]|nr:UDP-N-acetylmuramate--L-alanine ligase [bacterium]